MDQGMSEPISPENPKSGLKWTHIAVLTVVAFGVLGLIGENVSETKSPTVVTETYDDSWIPAGFSGYPENDNIAWRWATESETRCTYSSGACWTALVIAKNECRSGIYAEVAIFDKSGVQIDFANEQTTRVLPNTKVSLTFDTFNESADTARISEISCS